MIKNCIFAIPLCAYFFQACVKYDAEPFMGKVLPRVTGYNTGVTNDWLYINLGQNKIVYNKLYPNELKEGEQYELLNWDLAFCGHKLRTNSGTSGKGKGGAADLGYGGYNKWHKKNQLPNNLHFEVDDSTVIITMSRSDWNKYLLKNNLDFSENPWFDPNKGPVTTNTSGNPILARAMTFLGPPPSYTPSYHTYVVRTADGKHFYKLQIISWHNAKQAIGDTGGEISYYCEELK